MQERQISNFDELKILIVSPYSMEPTGGVQKHIQGYGRYLMKNGHVPEVVYPKNPGSDNPTLVDCASKVHLLSETSRQTHNGTVAHTAKRIPVNPAHAWQLLNKAKPDIIHSHDPYASAPALQLMLQSRIPVLNSGRIYNFGTFHAAHVLEDSASPAEIQIHKKNKKFYNRVSKLRYLFDPILDGTIVVSEVTQDFAKDLYPRKHELIPNGIETQIYSQEDETIDKFIDGKVNILYVGRLEGRKGVKQLAESYARLKRENPNIRLIVVGDGPQKKDIEEIRDRWGVEDIELVGRVSDADLPKYYKTADICAFMATHGEAQGMVLIEAMAAGKAVLAGNNRGYSSVISHMENGLLADPRNIDEVVSYLRMLVDNEVFRKHIADMGQDEAQKYDWDSVGPRVIGFYKEKILQ